MQYPKYPSVESATHLANRLIVDVGQRESDYAPQRAKYESQFSKQMGEFCLHIGRGGFGTVEAERRAVTSIRQTTPPRGIFESVFDIMAFHDDAHAVSVHQKKLHARVMESLSGVDTATKSGRGGLVELTALGLLTRYAHPRMLAYPSLPHHENTDSRTNIHFDIGVILASSDDSATTAHSLQVKSNCLVRCDNEATPNHVEKVKGLLSKYTPAIQLVSGCCDLGMVTVRGSNPSVATSLLKEFEGSASQSEIRKLDIVTDNLLLDMTMDTLQRGTYGSARARKLQVIAQPMPPELQTAAIAS